MRFFKAVVSAIAGARNADWQLGARHYEDLVCSRHVAPSDRAHFADQAIKAHSQGRHGKGGHTPGRGVTFRTRGNIRRVR